MVYVRGMKDFFRSVILVVLFVSWWYGCLQSLAPKLEGRRHPCIEWVPGDATKQPLTIRLMNGKEVPFVKTDGPNFRATITEDDLVSTGDYRFELIVTFVEVNR